MGNENYGTWSEVWQKILKGNSGVVFTLSHGSAVVVFGVMRCLIGPDLTNTPHPLDGRECLRMANPVLEIAGKLPAESL